LTRTCLLSLKDLQQQPLKRGGKGVLKGGGEAKGRKIVKGKKVALVCNGLIS